jgi:hypothetical protein
MAELREMFNTLIVKRDQNLTETAEQSTAQQATIDALTVEVENLKARIVKPEFKAGATPDDTSTGPVKPAGRMDPTLG